MVLTGRKRFLQDLNELQVLSKKGWKLHDVVVKGLRAGDDEGAIQFRLFYDGEVFASVHLFVNDTSLYPKEHQCFAYDQESDAHETVSEVLENVASAGPKPLKDTISRLVNTMAVALGYIDDDMDLDDEVASINSEGGGMDEFQATHQAQQTVALKKDFLEVVAADWRPGLIRSGSNEFVVCVSCPVVKLSVPPTALAAWDRRLIMPDQHLTLLISGFHGSYPALSEVGQVVSGFARIRFNVGLSGGKPDKEIVESITRNFGLKEDEKYVPEPEPEIPEYDEDDPDTWDIPVREPTPELEPTIEPGRFDKFSLSTSLESLMNEALIPLIQLRLKFGIGWAGAELLLSEKTARQISAEEAYDALEFDIKSIDAEEMGIAHLPLDPFFRPKGAGIEGINLPLVAYSYLVRRTVLCPRYCLVCHQRIKSDVIALKPYVCEKGLCAYQYYALSFGTSIEYDLIHNPAVVDLLISLAVASAMEGQLKEELPTGLGLRVPKPPTSYGTAAVGWGYAPPVTNNTTTEELPGKDFRDNLYEFDQLPLEYQRGAIVDMLNRVPKVSEMRQYLLRKTPGSIARARQSVRAMKDDVPDAAWTLLRWCVASCTAYIEELNSAPERVQNVGSAGMYHQFRFSVGSPQAEAKFDAAVQQAIATDARARQYPTLYAWHGSPLKNWHSIIRQGLHYKDIAHGRAYGNGVYFAKDGNTSMSYARAASSKWKNSELVPTTALAIAEIVNLPGKFTSTNPYFVVPDVTWISTRYLLVGSGAVQQKVKDGDADTKVSLLTLDPTNAFVMSGQSIGIPLRAHHLEELVQRYRKQHRDAPFDAEDQAVFQFEDRAETPPPVLPSDDWKHDPSWVEQTDYHLLSAPTQASPMSTMHLQKEFKYMMEEQRKTKSLRELGFYISPEIMGDNLFQWIVELHSFDKALPLAQDLERNNINSLLFEIRFPPNFPHSPPFFRLIKPRLLPFLQGGGGHVTAGGSICMDLLVQDGWLPSYNIAAVLLQIRMAISSTDPRPARLASGTDWKRAYGVQEALEGFTRAAGVHGWRVPEGTRQLVLQ